MSLAYDERLYALIRELPAVAALIGNRMYHIEVVQGTGEPYSKYPSIVYMQMSDNRIGDLSGAAAGCVRRAQFQFMCFSRASADIRAMAKAINALSGDVATATASGFEWLEVEDTTDDFEIPFEYDEKAMKYTVIDVVVLYREE